MFSLNLDENSADNLVRQVLVHDLNFVESSLEMKNREELTKAFKLILTEFYGIENV